MNNLPIVAWTNYLVIESQEAGKDLSELSEIYGSGGGGGGGGQGGHEPARPRDVKNSHKKMVAECSGLYFMSPPLSKVSGSATAHSHMGGIFWIQALSILVVSSQ